MSNYVITLYICAMMNNDKIQQRIDELKQASNKPVIVFTDENGEMYIGYDGEELTRIS